VPGGEIGDDYEVPVWTDTRFYTPITPFERVGECRWAGFRCYRQPDYQEKFRGILDASFENNGELLGLRLSNWQGTEEVFPWFNLSAPSGIPGVDNGPLLGFSGDFDYDFGKWIHAVPGRAAVVPNKITGGVSVSASVQQRMLQFLFPYWEVVSVTAPPNTQGFTNGQQVSIYTDEIDPEDSDTYLINPFQDAHPGPAPRFATGVVATDYDGNIASITIIDGGVFYKELPSSDADPKDPQPKAPAIVCPMQIEVLQVTPSQGSGGKIDVVDVGTDTNSSGFGKGTLAVSNGGDGYLKGITGYEWVRVQYRGPYVPAVATMRGSEFDPTYVATTNATNCNALEFTATLPSAFEDPREIEISPDKPESLMFGSKECCGRTDWEQVFLPGKCKFYNELILDVDVEIDCPELTRTFTGVASPITFPAEVVAISETVALSFSINNSTESAVGAFTKPAQSSDDSYFSVVADFVLASQSKLGCGAVVAYHKRFKAGPVATSFFVRGQWYGYVQIDLDSDGSAMADQDMFCPSNLSEIEMSDDDVTLPPNRPLNTGSVSVEGFSVVW
jgi:hypothetical protein